MGVLTTIFKLLAGIGLFLFAMHMIEESLKNLAGRKFKRFLQRTTSNKIGAIAGGAIVTGLLQSSTMVSLMVLAFVGAGVLKLKNAFAIILGANIGTTLDSWLVATLGFKVNIEVAAYPAVFTGGLLLILFGKRKSFKYSSYFLLGFGLLFIGLSFMKSSMEASVNDFSFTAFPNMPLIAFLMIGFLITLTIQSSSATMALTLSALYTGIIGFVPAAALILGSETGTSIKLMLGSVGGTASKKRLALGNVLFNFILTIIAFSWLRSILFLITDIFHIHDPLIGLVTFSSLLNVMGVIIFIPFLNFFVKFLERFYQHSDVSVTAFISATANQEPDITLDLIRRETEYYLHNALLFNVIQFGIDPTSFEEIPMFKELNEKRNFESKSPEEQYEFMKLFQGELQAFYLEQRAKLSGEHLTELNQMISSVRSAMHAIKSIKDIGRNITDLSRSSKDIKFDFFLHHKNEIQNLYLQFNSILRKETIPSFALFKEIYDNIEENYLTSLNKFYKEALHASLEDIDITTIINFNKALFSSNEAMLIALKDFLLEEKEARDFNEIPVYKT